MGSQDKGGRETKKPKKGSIKINNSSVMAEAGFEPEVVKKGKKK